MRHSVGSLDLVAKTRRQLPIQFPSRLIEPEHGDGLGAIRGVVLGLLFELAVLVAVALAWRLRLIFQVGS
jgi:hypothetical protein